MVKKVLVCLLAGLGAGLGTGFAGMSAAAVISPMLITFLGMEPYEAVGIALASDVLASAASAWTYGKNKNLDIRNGLLMMAAVLAFTVVGSYVASLVPSRTMGSFSVLMTMLLGIKFIIRPVMTTREAMQNVSKKKRMVQSIVCGAFIGMICGFVGAGGGMMMLLILTSVMGYELKTAVGTSVFIMAFTALTGAVSHFTIGGLPDGWTLALCMAFTLLFAQIAAKIANKSKPETLNRVVGVVFGGAGRCDSGGAVSEVSADCKKTCLTFNIKHVFFAAPAASADAKPSATKHAIIGSEIIRIQKSPNHR